MLCLIWFPGWDKFYEQVFWLIRWLILLRLESHFPSDSFCFAQIWDKSSLIVWRGNWLNSPTCQATQGITLADPNSWLSHHLNAPIQGNKSTSDHLASFQTRAKLTWSHIKGSLLGIPICIIAQSQSHCLYTESSNFSGKVTKPPPKEIRHPSSFSQILSQINRNMSPNPHTPRSQSPLTNPTHYSISAFLPLLPSTQRLFSLSLISSNICILPKPNGIPQPSWFSLKCFLPL